MPNLKENPRDRVLLAYEKELLDQIYGRNAAFPESSRQRAEELADEFCQTFLGNGDPAGQEVRQALNGIALNGRPFPFFRDDLAVQGELSREQSRRIMAYAMLKIRQEVLYTENPKIPDGRNHVVFRGADGRAQSLVREEAVQLSPPVRPQELGGWKAFANRVFGAYKEETAAYEAGRLEYEEKKRAYDAQQAHRSMERHYEEMGVPTAAPAPPGTEDDRGRRPMGFSELQKGLRSADHWWHVNSREYKEVLASLNEVNQLWDAQNTPENGRRMLAAYDRLEKSCAAYLKERSGSHETDMGTRRAELVRKIQELQRKERQELWKELDRMQPAGPARAPQTVGDILSEARRLDLSQAERIAEIGAGTSTRNDITIQGYRGIFTEDRRNDPNKPVDSMGGILQRAVEEDEAALAEGRPHAFSGNTLGKFKEWIDGIPLYEKLRELRTEDEIFDYLSREMIFVPEGPKAQEEADKRRNTYREFAKRLEEAYRDPKAFIDSLPDYLPGAKMKGAARVDADTVLQNMLYLAYGESSIPREDVSKLIKSAQHGIFATNLIRLSSRRDPQEVNKYLQELAKEGHKPAFTDSGEIEEIRRFFKAIEKKTGSFRVAAVAQIPMDRRSHLNERNIATSLMADLLGCPEAAARSETAKVTTQDGTVKTGVLMEFVEGLSGGALWDSEGQEKVRTAALRSGGLKRTIADLQVLDCICGQIDRHMNNVIFQTDPQTGAIVSMKGIDNDMSFGLSTVNNFGYHGIRLGMIRTVSESMVQALNSLDKEVIDYRFHHLLTKEERDALWNRVDTMRDWVNSDFVRKVPDDQWENEKWETLAEGLPQPSGYAPCENLFYRVGSTVLGIRSEQMKAARAHSSQNTMNSWIQYGMDFAKADHAGRQALRGRDPVTLARAARSAEQPRQTPPQNKAPAVGGQGRQRNR